MILDSLHLPFIPFGTTHQAWSVHIRPSSGVGRKHQASEPHSAGKDWLEVVMFVIKQVGAADRRCDTVRRHRLYPTPWPICVRLMFRPCSNVSKPNRFLVSRVGETDVNHGHGAGTLMNCAECRGLIGVLLWNRARSVQQAHIYR